MRIWDDVQDPGTTAAWSIKLLGSLDTEQINFWRSVYQLPIGVWEPQLLRKPVNLECKHMCIWDDVIDPGPTDAGSTELLRGINTGKINVRQRVYQRLKKVKRLQQF